MKNGESTAATAEGVTIPERVILSQSRSAPRHKLLSIPFVRQPHHFPDSMTRRRGATWLRSSTPTSRRRSGSRSRPSQGEYYRKPLPGYRFMSPSQSWFP